MLVYICLKNVIFIFEARIDMNEMPWRSEQRGPWSFDMMILCSFCLRGCTTSFRTKPSRCCVWLWLCCIRNNRSCSAACMRDWKGSKHCIHTRNICANYDLCFHCFRPFHYSIQIPQKRNWATVIDQCKLHSRGETDNAKINIFTGFCLSQWHAAHQVLSFQDEELSGPQHGITILNALALRSGCR